MSRPCDSRSPKGLSDPGCRGSGKQLEVEHVVARPLAARAALAAGGPAPTRGLGEESLELGDQPLAVVVPEDDVETVLGAVGELGAHLGGGQLVPFGALEVRSDAVPL